MGKTRTAIPCLRPWPAETALIASAPRANRTKGGTMVGISFLYGIWAVLAIGSVIVTAMVLRSDD